MKPIREWFETIEGDLVIAWEDVIYTAFLSILVLVILAFMRWIYLGAEKERERRIRADRRNYANMKRNYAKRS
ncbi:MAG: hypothetical protein ACK5XN_31175 [Bacteroidota bacterium]|jgi:hypothetical protein